MSDEGKGERGVNGKDGVDGLIAPVRGAKGVMGIIGLWGLSSASRWMVLIRNSDTTCLRTTSSASRNLPMLAYVLKRSLTDSVRALRVALASRREELGTALFSDVMEAERRVSRSC